MAVRQLKGLNHCRLIKRRAKKMWRKLGCKRGMWDQCLRTAIQNHRAAVEAEAATKRIQEQLRFSSVVFEEGDEL